MGPRLIDIVAREDGTILEVLEVIDVKDPFTPCTIRRTWIDLERGFFEDAEAEARSKDSTTGKDERPIKEEANDG